MDEQHTKIHPMDGLFAAHALNDELLVALQIGNTDDSAAYTSALDALSGALAVDFAAQTSLARREAKPGRPALDQARDEAYRCYAGFILEARRQYGNDLPVLDVGSAVYSESACLAVLGKQEPAREKVRHADPVMRAYLLARLNLARGKGRCAALEYLVEQLPATVRTYDSELGRALIALYTCLSTRVAMQTTTMLKFAILLGGQVLEDTRQEVLQQTFGPGKDVMGYLTFDDTRPSSHRSGDEDTFRASIAKHAKRSVS